MPAAYFWITKHAFGRLGIAPRPRGGDWLHNNLLHLRNAGVDVVVSLLMAAEQRELDLQSEEATCQLCGMHYLSFPIADRQIPQEYAASLQFVQEISQYLAQQRNVMLHCRMGVGRAAMMGAAILAVGGLSVGSALEQIATVRGCPVPDTVEQ